MPENSVAVCRVLFLRVSLLHTLGFLCSNDKKESWLHLHVVASRRRFWEKDTFSWNTIDISGLVKMNLYTADLKFEMLS